MTILTKPFIRPLKGGEAEAVLMRNSVGRIAYSQDQRVDMVPPDDASVRVARQPGRRKDILPHPLVIGVGVFARQRVRKVHASTACIEILCVEVLDVQQMLL